MTGDETLRRAEEAELAARRARQDPGDEIVSPLADADERVIETALRPKRLAEFVGQARVRERLSLVLPSALRRDRDPARHRAVDAGRGDHRGRAAAGSAARQIRLHRTPGLLPAG